MSSLKALMRVCAGTVLIFVVVANFIRRPSVDASVDFGSAGEVSVSDSGSHETGGRPKSNRETPQVAPTPAVASARRSAAFEVVAAVPDPSIVTDYPAREAILRSKLPWWIRHQASKVDLRLIPEGAFVMGAVDTDSRASASEKPPRRVRISAPFYLGVCEITLMQLRIVFANRPKPAAPEAAFEFSNAPATAVTIEEASMFCSKYGFRLPSEAEWEYACRAGTRTVFAWGDEPGFGGNAANVRDRRYDLVIEHKQEPGLGTAPWDDKFAYIAPVGSYRANAFGIHDMIGNVAEWTADRYSVLFFRNMEDDARDPTVKVGAEQSVRGGCFQTSLDESRISFRTSYPSAPDDLRVGFRVVLPVEAYRSSTDSRRKAKER